MKLSHLTDKTLLSEIKILVHDERRSSLAILHHIKEIDRRKLYSDVKCKSLFDYCTRELGYSEGAAQRRIVAARMLATMPEIGPKIESGALNLTNIAKVSQHIKDSSDQKKVLREVENMTRNECEKKIFEFTGEKTEPKETKKRVSDDKIQIAIVLKDETVTLMDKLKAMMGGNPDSDTIVQYAMNAAIEKIKKTKFKQTERPKSPPPAKVGRYIQAYIKRDLYRQNQKCANCGSIHNLHFDHIKAFALGGTSGIENIRILCGNCNQRGRIRAKL